MELEEMFEAGVEQLERYVRGYEVGMGVVGA